MVCGAQTPPTATEAFNLRIRCKQMADQKANDLNAVDAQQGWEVVQLSSSSRYDPINNRCYIHIYHHTRIPGYEDVIRLLYDAQTNDLLADASIRSGPSWSKKDGSIWDESYKGQRLFKDDDANWEGAVTYMDEMMADPRKQ
jgi:hypothetical protein